MIAKPAALAAPMAKLALPLLLTALALLLASCSVLPKREPTTIYEPAHLAQADSADWPKVGWSLLVARPAAGQLLDTDRIVVRPAAGSVTVYKGASWSDSLPELVQTALLRRFEDSGKIMAVSRPGGGVRGEFQLLTELRVFDSVYVQPGHTEARVELFARLVRSRDGHVIAARNFRDTEAAAGEEVALVVDAFSRALGRLGNEVAGWTLHSGDEHAGDEAIPAGKR
jgi:cholesterol transport system auxiliary component